jgi:hypothetical protein
VSDSYVRFVFGAAKGPVKKKIRKKNLAVLFF